MDRVLIAIGGHIGDAIIASSVLPDIRRALPKVEIGLALPSWVLPVLEGHPEVSHFHVVDHWKVDRGNGSRLAKWMRFRHDSRGAVAEMRAARYDVAIDLYPFYPNMSLLLMRAGIPTRIGYESGGGGPAFTSALPWPPTVQHMALHFRALLSAAGIEATGDIRYSLPPLSAATTNSARQKLGAAGVTTAPYVVVHPGTGHPAKELPVEQWVAIIQSEMKDVPHVVITGHGAREETIATELGRRVPRAINLVGRTSLAELRAIFRGARRVIGPDSMAVHLAAAEGTPSICIVTPASEPEVWRPLSPVAQVRNAADMPGAAANA